MTRAEVYALIDAERARQDAKWGVQRHPDVDRVLTDRVPSPYHKSSFAMPGCTPSRMADEYEIPTAPRAKAICDGAARTGHPTRARSRCRRAAACGCARKRARCGTRNTGR